MKFSEAWLREWLDLPIDTATLATQFDMLGLPIEQISAAGKVESGVVVGKILAAKPHPGSDRLSLCEVNTGEAETYPVVCGAPNARAGLVTAFARPGSVLPGGQQISVAEIRGVRSAGMLCSEQELDLGEASEGIMELPNDAPLGASLAAYLQLEDQVFDIELTPNRGDCLSIRGLARELAARNRTLITGVERHPVPAQIDTTMPVELLHPQACSRYVGRVIRHIDPAAVTPVWMQERLRRAGVRPLSAVVDVTNYVMLELGQPMHAFDFDQLQGGIRVRLAEPNERIALLDGSSLTLDPESLVIADHQAAVALAGIMGGQHSAVSGATCNILLEAAFFAPLPISGRARHYGMHTESSHRFERGVDPQCQAEACERATRLVLDICGGEPGPLVDQIDSIHHPAPRQISLRDAQLERVLGIALPRAEIAALLGGLGLSLVDTAADRTQWCPPSHRFDLNIEADLLEELARLYGYDNMPRSYPAYRAQIATSPEREITVQQLRERLLARGYFEAITYSFVDERFDAQLAPAAERMVLANPLSSEMNAMRSTLWSGLLRACAYNTARQHRRVRLFEIGLTFARQNDELQQTSVIAGVATGSRMPEQWALDDESADFFDVKHDVEQLLALTGSDAIAIQPARHPALHPGQSAEISLSGQSIGWLGRLHPKLAQSLDLPKTCFMFELELAPLRARKLPQGRSLSRFPSVRRDLSLDVDEALDYSSLQRAVTEAAPDYLQQLTVFSVYRGAGVSPGRKSISLGLILQELSRTLSHDEVDLVVAEILQHLQQKLGAKLRD